MEMLWCMRFSGIRRNRRATRPLGLTTSDGAHYSYGHDFTKNVTEMLDETGRFVASYEYNPYGRTIIESGSLPSQIR